MAIQFHDHAERHVQKTPCTLASWVHNGRHEQTPPPVSTTTRHPGGRTFTCRAASCHPPRVAHGERWNEADGQGSPRTPSYGLGESHRVLPVRDGYVAADVPRTDSASTIPCCRGVRPGRQKRPQNSLGAQTITQGCGAGYVGRARASALESRGECQAAIAL